MRPSDRSVRSRRRGRRRRSWLIEALVFAVAIAVLGLAFGGRVLLGERPPAMREPMRETGAPGDVAAAALEAKPADLEAATADPAAKPADPEAATADGDLSEPAEGDPGKATSAGRDERAAAEASGRSKHTDAKAMAYFEKRWGKKDKAFKRVKDIRTIGGYLRIYTNLPASADNSATALTLCRRGLKYVTEEVGGRKPVIFVHSAFGQNGNPVLANILGPGDKSCHVTYPEPKS